MDRIAIVGNAGGGKSTLAHEIADRLGVEVTSVDDLQWRPGWEPAPEAEVRTALIQAQASERWVIDGWGPWDLVVDRLNCADTVVFVDMPTWMHHWLAAERLIAAASGRSPRERMVGCDDLDVTRLFFETIDRVDRTLVPQLRTLLPELSATVHTVTSVEQLSQLGSQLVPQND